MLKLKIYVKRLFDIYLHLSPIDRRHKFVVNNHENSPPLRHLRAIDDVMFGKSSKKA